MFEKRGQDGTGKQSGFKLTDTLDRRRVNAETTAWFHAHVGYPAKFSGKFNTIRGVVSIRNTFSAAATNVQKRVGLEQAREYLLLRLAKGLTDCTKHQTQSHRDRMFPSSSASVLPASFSPRQIPRSSDCNRARSVNRQNHNQYKYLLPFILGKIFRAFKLPTATL